MFLLELLLEFVIQVAGTVLLELVLAVTHALDEEKGARVPAVLWLALIGASMGGITLAAAPNRLLRPGPFVGVSLLLVPAALAGIMEAWGHFRQGRTKNVSHLATWYGGAALGLGVAAGRLVGLTFVHDVRALV